MITIKELLVLLTFISVFAVVLIVIGRYIINL